jgi:NodT family efflux transporter outer membrane factor (OMF) lipoprotein
MRERAMSLRFLPLSAAAVLVGCSVGPEYAPPVISSTAAGPFVAARSPATDALAPVPADWWRLFEDPVLDALVADALAANTDLRVAVGRLEQARAALAEVRVDRLPQGAISADAARGREEGSSGARTRLGGELAVAYEVDLFGRVRRNVEAAGADLLAAQADSEAVRVTIVAETARAYADAAGAAERLASARRIVALLDRSLHLTQRRVEIGETARIDSARIAALRHQREADIPALSAERDAALFRLAMLTGRAPADLPEAAGARLSSLRLSRPIPVGDGAQLLARRPDIRAAERRVAAATARIGVATADLYPQVSLGASLSSTSGSIGRLLSNPVGWLLGSFISWSFSDHSRARARVAGAEAGARVALAEFDGTVLRALQETETALSAYANALRRREALLAARGEAEVAARIVRAQQREGQVDSLELLDAERTFADTEAEVIELNAQVVGAQIDLFRALGGGWGT